MFIVINRLTHETLYLHGELFKTTEDNATEFTTEQKARYALERALIGYRERRAGKLYRRKSSVRFPENLILEREIKDIQKNYINNMRGKCAIIEKE